MPKRLVVIVGSVIGAIVLLLVVGWVWVLVVRNPLQALPASWLPWPITCSTRGCITTWSWQRQQAATEVFARLAEQEQPTPTQSLTTLVRQHLAHYGELKSPVTAAAAERYRREILHATDEAHITDVTGLSATEYDQLVVIPFLEQESLRQQRKAESPDDLYKQLAGERWIAVLPWHLTWSDDEAKVIQE